MAFIHGSIPFDISATVSGKKIDLIALPNAACTVMTVAARTPARFSLPVAGDPDADGSKIRRLTRSMWTRNQKDTRSVGYVFRNEDARRYDEWFETEAGRIAASIEQDLLLRLWSPPSSQRVLEVGCGTGLFLEWLAGKGHCVTGIDASPAMLTVAERRLGNRATLSQGYAERLPYDDDEFDTVLLITTLEYVDDPVKALREASRVARRHVLLGALNKYSLSTIGLLLSRLWNNSYYSHARFYSPFQLERLVVEALSGAVPMRRRTCLSLPAAALKYSSFLERRRLTQLLPFGHFIALRVDLRYPLQTAQDPLLVDLTARIAQAQSRIACRHGPLENPPAGRCRSNELSSSVSRSKLKSSLRAALF